MAEGGIEELLGEDRRGPAFSSLWDLKFWCMMQMNSFVFLGRQCEHAMLMQWINFERGW